MQNRANTNHKRTGAIRLDDEGRDVVVSGSFATGSVRARLGRGSWKSLKARRK